MDQIGVEYVSFFLKEHVTREEYLNKYQKAYDSFLKNHPDFLSLSHLFDSETGMYANYVEWKSLAAAKKAAKDFMQDAHCIDWLSLMEME